MNLRLINSDACVILGSSLGYPYARPFWQSMSVGAGNLAAYDSVPLSDESRDTLNISVLGSSTHAVFSVSNTSYKDLQR